MVTSNVRHALRVLFRAFGILTCGAASTTGQVIGGNVVDRDARGLSGLIVELLGAGDSLVAQTLSGDSGSFVLRAPRAGTFRVRALRIGFYPTVSDAIAVGEGTQSIVRLVLSGTPVLLQSVTISAERRCRVRPDSGTQAAVLWTEARKVLTNAALTSASQGFDVRVAMSSEKVSPSDGRILQREYEERDGRSVQPFVSAQPESLVEHGYVQQSRQGTTYFGPDAELLLSSIFAREHCFTARSANSASGERALVGLAFEPAATRQDHTDIRGVLWIDRTSFELRDLEFEYTGLPRPVADAGPGGRVHFIRLPDERWIVSHWSIRMPELRVSRQPSSLTSVMVLGRTALPTSASEISITGIDVRRGEVLQVRLGSRLVWSSRSHTVRGVVLTSDGKPVVGARVRIDSTARDVTTDSAGTFTMEGLPPGDYSTLVTTPETDALGLAPTRLALTVADSAAPAARLLLPALSEQIARACGDTVADPATALLHVLVLWASTDPSALSVEASWPEVVHQNGAAAAAARAKRVGRVVRTGSFWLCSVPRGVSVTVTVRSANTQKHAVMRIGDAVPYVQERVNVDR